MRKKKNNKTAPKGVAAASPSPPVQEAQQKKRKKKQIPLPMRTGVTGVGAEDVNVAAMAEYVRKDETEVIISEATIVTELTNSGAINRRRSYYLSWLVPDPENMRGALLRVDHFTLEVHNDGLFDVNVVIQQPHGHEACPSSVAAWVLLANETLKAGSRKHLTIHPVDNNFIVPLRSDCAGTDNLTFVAMSAVRQGLSQAGDKAPRNEVGLRLIAAAHYKASGNVLGGGKFFSLRSYSSDEGMFKVDPKPPVAVAVQDIVPRAASLGWASNPVKNVNLLTPVVNDRSGSVINDLWTGLSQAHTYRLPVPVYGKVNQSPVWGIYLRWNNFWYVTNRPDGATEQGLRVGDDKVHDVLFENLPILSADSLLTPLRKNNYLKLPVRRKGGLECMSLPESRHAELMLGDWKDDLLSAVSFVVGVIKVAAAVAGAAGLLNVVNDVESA